MRKKNFVWAQKEFYNKAPWSRAQCCAQKELYKKNFRRKIHVYARCHDVEVEYLQVERAQSAESRRLATSSLEIAYYPLEETACLPVFVAWRL